MTQYDGDCHLLIDIGRDPGMHVGGSRDLQHDCAAAAAAAAADIVILPLSITWCLVCRRMCVRISSVTHNSPDQEKGTWTWL